MPTVAHGGSRGGGALTSASSKDCRSAGRLLVYFALAAAGLTFLVTHNVRSTISVIIVTGACGIAAGTPLAILGAIGRAAREGAIIKGGLYLERLAAVDMVPLDKTGTLTYGVPEVVEISSLAGFGRKEILEVAATAEISSEHPVGKAIVRRAVADAVRIVEPCAFHYRPGKGVVAKAKETDIAVGNSAFFKERGITTPSNIKAMAIRRCSYPTEAS